MDNLAVLNIEARGNPLRIAENRMSYRYSHLNENGAMLQSIQESSDTDTLVEHLRRFNRKERYWLLKNALSESGTELPLSEEFRQRLGITIDMQIPPNAWWAFDYHIDWLFSALLRDRLASNCPERLTNPERDVDGDVRSLIRGTQEDFDFIVAFDRTIILMEAKGVTSWGNGQMASKCARLWDWKHLSDEIATERTDHPIDMILVQISPRPPRRLETLEWPDFVKLDGENPFFLHLDLHAAPTFFLVPERVGNGKIWRLRNDPRKNWPKPSSVR